MTPLGTMILLALRDQGWLVATNGDEIMAGTPDGRTAFVFPAEFFEVEELEPILRLALFQLVVTGGLWWPWPPDHRADVHGETPRSE